MLNTLNQMNLTPFKAKTKKVDHLLPERLHHKGPTPGMSSANSKPVNKEIEDKWVFKGRARLDPNEEEKKLVVGACLEIEVKILFQNHCFKYCEEIFRQI